MAYIAQMMCINHAVFGILGARLPKHLYASCRQGRLRHQSHWQGALPPVSGSAVLLDRRLWSSRINVVLHAQIEFDCLVLSLHAAAHSPIFQSDGC
jgi:hypothetical protein